MPSITYDRWEVGMDRRKGRGVSDANKLWNLKNAYINTGWVPQKRPGSTKIKTLSGGETGTVGLVPYDGSLHVFHGTAQNSVAAGGGIGFTMHMLPHPGGAAVTLDKIHDYEIFNGYIYVAGEYSNGDIYHHYLQDLTAWQASTAYSSGDRVEPTTPNGFVYECLTGGTSDASEPTWSTTVGGTTTETGGSAVTWLTKTKAVSDEPTTRQNSYAYTVGDQIILSAANFKNYTYECTGAGTSAAAEPTATTVFPDTIGATSTVQDGTVTWQNKGVTCYNGKSIQRAASKIFSLDTDNVPFSATAIPTDWITSADAGSLPTGIQSQGSEEPLALGRYNQLLVVFAIDNIQTWSVDPDPTLMLLDEIVPNMGTVYPKSVGNVSGDVYFLSSLDTGYRSLSTLALTQNLADVDVGGPIDAYVQEQPAPTNEPFSVWFQGGGQYWCIRDDSIDVYTFSRTAKVSAWSHYEYPWTITDACELSGSMYLRAGSSNEEVFKVDKSVYTDDGTAIAVECEMNFQAMKKPGQSKLIIGADIVCVGSTTVDYRYDPDDATLLTESIVVSGDSRRGGMIPVDMVATEIAPRFRHEADEDWRLDLVNLYYEVLTTQ